MTARRWRRWARMTALLGLIGLVRPAGAADVRAALGVEYDDNPFEETVDRQDGWVNRFYVAASGHLLNRSWGRLQVRHQGGLKRFWRAERRTPGSYGDVVTNDLEVSGQARVTRGLTLSGGGNLKIKNVNRVSSEEGYLRGAVEGTVTGLFGRGISGAAHYRRGGDDSRDAALSDVSLHETGAEVSYGRSRRMQGRAGVTWRWLDYGRPALEWLPGGGVTPRTFRQSDRLREVSVSAQGYRGMLFQVSYAFLHNRSNSFGYGFWAHRFQALMIRQITYGVDGQAYVTFQFRRYTDPLTPLPGGRSEADEYEQTVAVLRLSRQVTSRCGVSVQYGAFRNGARGGAGFYRKNVYAFSVDASL